MKPIAIHIFLVFLALALFSLELLLGSVNIDFPDVFKILINGEHEHKSWTLIILHSRLPRAIAALSAGMFLAISGLFMQTLFRNPLAGPHILGVSSGAGLGVALVVMGAGSAASYLNEMIIVAAAFAGAMLVLFLLFLISLRVRDVLTVLIFGVLLGAIAMAVVGILQYFSAETELKVFLIWTLGSFDGVELNEALFMLLSGLPFLFFTIYLIKPLNLLLTGEDYALSMGLNVNRSRLLVMLAAGALTALATAFCGPIGFVGIVVPHFARILLKTFDHRKLIPASLLIGINLMLFSDLISHVPGSDIILPVNSITSLIGIPFIFWMLLKKKVINES